MTGLQYEAKAAGDLPECVMCAAPADGDGHFDDADLCRLCEQSEIAARKIEDAKSPATDERGIDHDAIHHWFSLSYCSYLTLPRSVLQSMPQKWQSEFVALLDELGKAASAAGIETPDYTIVAKDGRKFVHDPWRDYDRGRRNVFREIDADRDREGGA